MAAPDPQRLREAETSSVTKPMVTPPEHGQTPDHHVPAVHLNLNVRGLSASPSLAVNKLSAELVRDGRQIFRLGLGQSPFPVPEPVVETLSPECLPKGLPGGPWVR